MKKLVFKEWIVAKSFFVAMGGYMLRLNGDYKPISADNFIKWQRSGTSRLLRSPVTIPTEPISHSVDILSVELTSGSKLVKAYRLSSHGSAVELSWVSKEDIALRGKADVFLEGIACTQIGWILVQYIVRCARSLATSSLEAPTVAYVVCALFSYSAW